MKKTEQEIEALTNQALNSLDNVQPVEANAFLYAKVKNRLISQRQEAAARHTRLMFRLSAVLLMFIGINAGSFYAMKKWQQPTAVKPEKALTGAAAINAAYFGSDNNTYSY